MATSDALLLERSRTDPQAFRELYERYATRIYAFHRRCCGDANAAQDLTAETFAQAWLIRGRFRDEAGGSAAPWLYGIARNLLAASVRRRRIEQAARRRLGLLEDRAACSPDPATPEPTWLEALAMALDELPPGQREAVRLRFEQDLSYDALARSLATTPQAARVRVHRALTALRTKLAATTEATR
jgi:RNA polymerase sigma factor (sigma-70 family)